MQYQTKLKAYCAHKFKCDKHTPWQEDIENILLLLKLLPSKPKKNKDAVKPFVHLMDKMIVYRVVIFGFRYYYHVEYFSVQIKSYTYLL